MSLFAAEAFILVAATTFAIWDPTSTSTAPAPTPPTTTTAPSSTNDGFAPTLLVSSTSTAPFTSVGLFYTCLLLYIAIATCTHLFAFWKLYTVWNTLARHRPRPCALMRRQMPVCIPPATQCTASAECPICWMTPTNTASVCPCCQRAFHTECLQQWVATGAASCPWCRGSLQGDECTRRRRWWWCS